MGIFDRWRRKVPEPKKPTPTEAGIYIVFEDKPKESIMHYNTLLVENTKSYVISTLSPAVLRSNGLKDYTGYLQIEPPPPGRLGRYIKLEEDTTDLNTILRNIKKFLERTKDSPTVILFHGADFFALAGNFDGILYVLRELYDLILEPKKDCRVFLSIPKDVLEKKQIDTLRRAIPADVIE